MSKIFFTSDNHFWHTNILKFCRNTREGDTVEEMNEILIRNWQEQVGPEDTVYMLGDTFFCQEAEAISIMERLPGKKHLIYGNHDKVIKNSTKLQSMFESVQDYKEITIDKQLIVMFHFPIYDHNAASRGSIMLHGHRHGNPHNIPGRIMDVGIDTHPSGDMKLWTLEDILHKMEKIFPLQHHAR